MPASYEIRDPIHGFVSLSAWERDVVNHTVFQRLRRIRQLAWTDVVYPGAMHTRFEHSLGVMHVATQMFDRINATCRERLRDLGFEEDGLKRQRTLIRLAALLHDVGHSPFSHAGEDLMPTNPETGRAFKHEQYSGQLIRVLMRDVIDDNPGNRRNHGITAAEVAEFIEGGVALDSERLFWRELVSSQLDADRADYLLRDSYHAGVRYGHYDLARLIASMTVVARDDGPPRVAVEEGGWHAAEGLIWARYQMFTQVYFHKTRVAYDHHIARAMGVLLEEAQRGGALEQKDRFPPPTSEASLRQYLAWTDWRALGMLEAGGGGEHGEILRTRRHYRLVYDTPEQSGVDELDLAEQIGEALGPMLAHVGSAKTNWYNPEGEIMVLPERGVGALSPLSRYSAAMAGFGKANKRMLYVPLEHRANADRIVKRTLQPADDSV
jgi:HD superfamily phosphohydrolase